MTSYQPNPSNQPADPFRFLPIEVTMGPKLPSDRSDKFEKIARLRAQIAAGTYRVSAADLADSIIQRFQIETGTLPPEPRRGY